MLKKIGLVTYLICLFASTIQNCSIKLQINDYERVCHQLVLIRGKINCPVKQSSYPNTLDTRTGRFIVATRQDNVTSSWPINSYHDFKVVVRLQKGHNRFNISYYYSPRARVVEKASTILNLIYRENYNLEPLSLVILAAKDSNLTFDMDKASIRAGKKNDINSAIKRFGLFAMLWQALTSDDLNYFGYRRKSFRLELDCNNNPVVQIVRSKKTLSQFRKEYYKDNGWPITNSMLAIQNSSFWLRRPIYERKNMVFASLVIDARWLPLNKSTELGVALGGCYMGLMNLGAYGSNMMFANPENESELISSFTNITKPGTKELCCDDDSMQYQYINYNGGFLHEAGHAFCLGHTEYGIMGSSWLFNRYFLSIERNSNNTFSPIRDRVDEMNTSWTAEYALKLSQHKNIAESLSYNNPYASLLIWKQTDAENYFFQESSTYWREFHGIEIFAEFSFNVTRGNMTILYDSGRGMYVGLNSTHSMYGFDSNVENFICYGTWAKYY